MKQDNFRRQTLPEAAPAADSKQIEKRSHARFAVSVDAEAFDPVAKKAASGKVVDLGLVGCFVESNKLFPSGTEVHLNLHCGDRVFHCKALVTHTAERGMGLTFTEADPEQGMSVLDWVGELSRSFS